MTSLTFEKTAIIRDLGDGLVLRLATSADDQRLSDFNAMIHANPDASPRDERVAIWTHDLLTKPHPTFRPEYFTIVEDTCTGKIVSSLNLIPQTWRYAGIPFELGRPELVGTDPAYRNRGLVRAQFEVIHQWCAERGYVAQAITGIPYYYRLFGYEMALELTGGRAGFIPQIPKLKDGESEPYLVRPATEDDLPFIFELYELGCKRYLISCVYNIENWRYLLKGMSADNIQRFEIRIITTPQGEKVGFFLHPIIKWGPMLTANLYEIIPGLSWAAVTPSVIRYLQVAGKDLPGEFGNEEFHAFGFWLGSQHPVYDVLLDRLPRVRQSYAYYMRVPDLPGFLRIIKPALEARLAHSPMVGHTGELKITFYRAGLRMVFDQGRIAQIEEWRPEPVGGSGNAGFPDLTFLRVLFGFNSPDEVKAMFPDCWFDTPENHALLNFLFPKQASDVWPVA